MAGHSHRHIMQDDDISCIYTPGRRQSKTLFTIDESGSKIARNSGFDCHLSPIWRQMAIKNSVSNDFCSTFVNGINVFHGCQPGVIYKVPNSMKENVNSNFKSSLNYTFVKTDNI